MASERSPSPASRLLQSRGVQPQVTQGALNRTPPGSTALRPALAAITRFLSLPEERLIGHDRLVRVLVLHMLDVGVVVGHADHQARGLTEVLTEATQVVEHGGIPLTLQARPGTGFLCPCVPCCPRPKHRP